MPVEFISATHTTPSTETTGAGRHFGFDVDYTRRFVRYLDEGGFDWTLVAYGSVSADSAQVAQFVVSNSERIKPMLAHRPGFVFPTLAAKSFATIDQIGQGRLGIHISSGGTDAEQRREGDYLSKSERYERSDEFIQILRRVWTEDGPISHQGKYYKFEDFQSNIKPYQDAIPVSVGGSSEDAYRVGGRQGDIFGLWGEPLKETAEQIASVNAQADAAGRPHPRIWVSFRPIVAPTDELAWEKAHQVLAQTKANIAVNGSGRRRPPGTPQNVGSQRLLEVAERGELHDRALWTALDRDRGGRVHHGARRQLRDRGPGPARLRGRGLRTALDPWLGPAERRDRLRALRASARPAGTGAPCRGAGWPAMTEGSRSHPLRWRATEDGAVFVEGASAWLECSVYREVTVGDHDIVLLLVHELDSDPSVAPLVFHGSRFRRLEP